MCLSSSADRVIINYSSKIVKEPIIIFQHIPKTAGTTLRYIIQYQFPPSAICELYGSSGSPAQRIAKLQSLSKLQQQKIKIINTHVGFGLHDYLQQPCRYITFLREPVQRAVSMYYYFQKTKNPQFVELSLEEFVRTYPGVQNGMTKNLAGIVLQTQLGTAEADRELVCDRSSLEIARANLQQHFKFVGISERFDESLLLLRQILGWKIPLFDKSNTSKKPKNIDRKVLKLIERHNELDLQLYESATTAFEELIAKQEFAFEREIAKFHKANQSLTGKLYYRANTFYNRAVNRIYKELARS